MAQCKHCGGSPSREWTNKRGQRMGKCGGCGKLVYIGKAEKTDGAESSAQGKEQPKPAAEPEPAATGTGRTAGSGNGGGWLRRILDLEL